MRILLYLTTVIVISLVGCSSFDEPVTTEGHITTVSRYITNEEACQIASEAFVNFDMEPMSRSSRTAFATLYRPTRSRSIEDSLFYIVNFTEGGFAIISTMRDSNNPVVAISDKGSFEEDGNENLQEYMDCLLTNGNLNKLPDSTKTVVDFKPDTVITYHDRFLPTLWGQRYPYNKYCPVLSDGTNAVVGCVAVAMGQVLAYHRRPESINGYALNWSEMLMAKKIYSLSSEGENCVARLLRECGRLVNMSYGTSSSAYTSDVPAVMKKLGFSNAVYHQDLEKCINSIKTEGPVQMRGPGHSWVADAAKVVVMKSKFLVEEKKEYYLHMNWGWNGSSDGYFIVYPGYNDNDVNGYNNLSYITGVN